MHNYVHILQSFQRDSLAQKRDAFIKSYSHHNHSVRFVVLLLNRGFIYGITEMHLVLAQERRCLQWTVRKVGRSGVRPTTGPTAPAPCMETLDIHTRAIGLRVEAQTCVALRSSRATSKPRAVCDARASPPALALRFWLLSRENCTMYILSRKHSY